MFTGQLDDKFGIAQKLLLQGAAVSLLVSPLAMPSPAMAAEQYWDSGDVSPDGAVDGGNGIWDASTTNWTDVTGTTNATWGDDVGIFGGPSGTVTVQGTQTFTELQFLTWGYYLNDDSIGGVLNAATGGATINVDTDVSATIYLPFAGGGITKTGAGTLSLLFDEIVDATGTVNTWVVEDGTLLINGGFKAGSRRVPGRMTRRLLSATVQT